jgi:hypothetical protein
MRKTPKHRLRPRPRKATAKTKRLVSVGREAWPSAGVFSRIGKRNFRRRSKLTSAYEPKYDRDPFYVLFKKVSNIDQRLLSRESRLVPITARCRQLPVTESITLPPDLRRASCHPPSPIPIHSTAVLKSESLRAPSAAAP